MGRREKLFSTTMLAGIVGGVCVTGKPAQAADIGVPYTRLPSSAVDGFNSKWEVLGGTLDHKTIYGYRGAFSMPLAGQWGLQIDTSAGSLERRAFGSIGAHLFSRVPSQGLAGLYVNHVHWDQFGGVRATHVAFEGARYFGQWTLEGIVGVEFGNSASNVTTSAIVGTGVTTVTTVVQSYDVETRFMDQVNLKYYFTDNWDGYVGHRYLGGKNALALGSEVGLRLGHVMGAAFVEGRVGSKSFEGVWGGLKIYFGQKDKTLIRRHREDDPMFWDGLSSILNTSNIAQSTQDIFCLKGCVVVH